MSMSGGIFDWSLGSIAEFSLKKEFRLVGAKRKTF
ncbi:hypothetical protein GcC1_094036 [Golovinomyces cichoracearum]|uniref:Uncharacterized protein n=1 Tax=Golovinomyces cichoracearum TaxID=62708 RepID=A0A420ICM6_9PEZI|nr:hypothetical protein GcC1_094036 [Golovinomyces cichoracearum]